MSLMIKKDKNSNVRIEIKCNDVIKKVAAWYDGNGAWQKLYFDFSTNGVEGNPTEITIFPTTDAVDGEQTIYLDNIQIEDSPPRQSATSRWLMPPSDSPSTLHRTRRNTTIALSSPSISPATALPAACPACPVWLALPPKLWHGTPHSRTRTTPAAEL